MKVIKQSQRTLKKAITVIKSGGVVICPTDTVYGFLADATNKKAVEKIYKIKTRPKSKPLSVFIKDLHMAKELAEINDKQAKILQKYWPGKYTFVLKHKLWDVRRPTIYGVVKETIAIRIPKYVFLNQLLKKVNRPLVQTSVNMSGQAPLVKIGDILKQFQDIAGSDPAESDPAILLIDAGNLKKGKPSKIIDLRSKTEGVLTRLR